MSSVILHRAGVIGQPVAHSLSPVLHRAAYKSLGLHDWHYQAYSVSPAQLEQMLAKLAAPAATNEIWEGLSVTMPHKQRLAPLLDLVDPLAATVGSINTVVAQRSGKKSALLTGFNTDVAGIVGAVTQLTDTKAVAGKQIALIIGSGATACSALAAVTQLGYTRIVVAARNHYGSGRALAAAHRMGIEIETINWNPQLPSANLDLAWQMTQANLVVSTLPSGAADCLAIPLQQALVSSSLRTKAALLDVIYAPWPTQLASVWQQGGGVVIPGWLMLLYQAVPQVKLMTGFSPDIEAMYAALRTEISA